MFDDDILSSQYITRILYNLRLIVYEQNLVSLNMAMKV